MPVILCSQNINYPDTINVLPEVRVDAKQSLNYAGTKTSNVDSAIIAEKKTLTLSELISENTSIFIKTHGRGAMATASFRGTGSSHTEIVWNNIPLTSPMLGMVDFSLIPVYTTDIVQLQHGLAGVWQGTGALGGRIVLGSIPNWKNKFALDVTTCFGSYNTIEDAISITLGNNKISSKTNLYFNKSDNDFAFENQDILGGGIQKRENAAYLNYGLTQQLFFRPNNHNIISAKVWLHNSERSIPMLTTNESGAGNNLNRQGEKSLRANLEWQKHNTSSLYSLSSSLSLQNTDYQLQSYINGMGYMPVVESIGKALSIYNSANAQWKFLKVFSAKFGAKFNWHDVDSYESVYGNAYDKKRLEYGALASIFFDNNKNLRGGLVLNQEFYDSVIAPFVPVLQIEYSMNTSFLIRANIGRNFHKPSLNDLYFKPGGNINLQPEKGYSAELGGVYSLNSKKTSLKIDCAAFVTDIEEWIMWKPTHRGYWTPINLDEVLAYGAEASLILKHRWNEIYIHLNVNYSLTKSINRSRGDASFNKQLIYIPVHSANAFAKLSYKTFSIVWQWNYFSERYTTTDNSTSNLFLLYPYFMNDVYVTKSFEIDNHRFILQGGVYNVFNEQYSSVLWQPMPGINCRISLRYLFEL